jgi:hypothetical protein
MIRRYINLTASGEEWGEDEDWGGDDEWGEDDDFGGDEGSEDN